VRHFLQRIENAGYSLGIVSETQSREQTFNFKFKLAEILWGGGPAISNGSAGAAQGPDRRGRLSTNGPARASSLSQGGMCIENIGLSGLACTPTGTRPQASDLGVELLDGELGQALGLGIACFYSVFAKQADDLGDAPGRGLAALRWRSSIRRDLAQHRYRQVLVAERR
jgi:hypothetical protein